MIIENDYYTVFKTVGDYNYDYFYGRVSEPIDPSKASSIKDVVVKIQLHNKLIESNADEVDEKIIFIHGIFRQNILLNIFI